MRRYGDPGAGRRAIEAAYRLAAPEVVAPQLSAAYEAATVQDADPT
jgi:hypothetical protein